ncbi:MAG: pantetheine-phosphate adenylyltransferase [Campylobacterales bacterium]
MSKIAIYPGTFDPLTNGHFDIATRALRLFDKVVVSIAISREKSPMFSLEQRYSMAKTAFRDYENIEIATFSNLLVDFARTKDSSIIIRGLRAVSDFEFELQMAYTNVSLRDDIETVHLMPSLENAFVSSSVVRTILRHKGDVSHIVPESVMEYIKDSMCM